MSVSASSRQRRLLDGNMGRVLLLLTVVVVASFFLVAVASGGVIRELGWLSTIAAAVGVACYLAFRSPQPPQP